VQPRAGALRRPWRGAELRGGGGLAREGGGDQLAARGLEVKRAGRKTPKSSCFWLGRIATEPNTNAPFLHSDKVL
jgi:hypothetical protein